MYNKCKQKYLNIQNIILVVLYYLMSEANLRVGSVSLLCVRENMNFYKYF